MQAPEIGRLVAEQVAGGAITSLDVRELQLSRFAENRRTSSLGMVF
jgi:hypothetical protein